MSPLANQLHRAPLDLLAGGSDAESATSWRWFCGRCAASPVFTHALPPVNRVCGVCGFGLMLQAMSDEVPSGEAVYLVVDASFAVQALSKSAEIALGTTERSALNRHVTQLLIPADRSAGGSANFAVALSMAARGNSTSSQTMVCRANTFGERIRARITACGPPPSALIVLP
jgi:hypothetical protein